MLIQAIERFSKSVSWKCFFKLNPDLKVRGKQNFGFNSTRAPPKILGTPLQKTSTTLSTYFLKEKNFGHEPKITWRFLETNIPTFNSVTGNCRLCLREKYNISFNPQLATLNSRSEIFSACRHKRSELLVPPNYKSSGG